MWDTATYNHVGQAVVRNEGCFVTSRIMTRKTGRKAKVVREILMALTVPPSHPEHIGTAREIGKNMLVFYKCPPDLIKPTALAKFGIELELYQALFLSALKAPPSQSILPVVLRDSPYMCAHYETLLQGLSSANETTGELAPASVARSMMTSHLHAVKDESFDSFHNMSGSQKDVCSPQPRSVSVNSSYTSETFENRHELQSNDGRSFADVFKPRHGGSVAPAAGPFSRQLPEQTTCNEAETSANVSSDMENIDILNDSDQQSKSGLVESTVNDSSLGNGDANASSHSQQNQNMAFSSPLLGLQRMLTSQNSIS